jgi:hypothetical protein
VVGPTLATFIHTVETVPVTRLQINCGATFAIQLLEDSDHIIWGHRRSLFEALGSLGAILTATPQ